MARRTRCPCYVGGDKGSLSVAVLMATYNAGRYIHDQVNSILNQTLNPDTLLITDDCSTDGTIRYLQEVRDSSPSGTTVHLSVNQHNLGWKENFRKILLECSDEYIFFCDQDDVWKNNKIETYISVFTSNPKVNVIVSPFEVIGASDAAKDNTMRGGYKCPPPPNSIFDCRVESGAGCTIAVRGTYVDKLRPYFAKGLAHDYLFRQAAYFDGSLAVMEDASIYRRIHGNNASEGKRTLESSIESCKESALLGKMLGKYGFDLKVIEARRLGYLLTIEYAYSQRASFLETKKLWRLVSSLFAYPAMYRRLRFLFGDVALAFGILRRDD